MAAAYLRQLVPSLVRGPPGPAGPLPPPPPPPLFLKAEYPEVMHSKAGWVAGKGGVSIFVKLVKF